jgi:hypothetical protein
MKKTYSLDPAGEIAPGGDRRRVTIGDMATVHVPDPTG